MKKTILATIALSMVASALTLNNLPKKIELKDENGGYALDNKAWSSSMLKGKVHLLFYVDPDERKVNSELLDAVSKQGFDSNSYEMISIINLKATWLPNFAIEAKLKKKQKELPLTVFVKDKAKVLVKEWDLADDASNILLFDKEGKVIYEHVGKVENEEQEKLFELINKEIEK